MNFGDYEAVFSIFMNLNLANLKVLVRDEVYKWDFKSAINRVIWRYFC